MRTLSITLALATLFALIPAGAASDRNVTDLSDGALLGQIQSTNELQQDFDAHSVALAVAGSQIGLTQEQYHDVRLAIAEGQARYVELPRHIDAMSGARNGRVFIVRNIRIPKGVYGWEVDLDEAHDVVKVYVPNRCGNLSLVRVAHPQVLAEAPVYHRDNAPYAPPAVAAYAPRAESYDISSTPPPAIAYQPEASVPQVQPVQPVVNHHFAMIPWIAGALVTAFIVRHGGGGGITIGGHTSPIVVATPTPPPVSCTTAVRRKP